MAIPTFNTISQNLGLTIGNDIVRIIGSNFRIAPIGENPHCVKVFFNGVEAKRVDVLSDTELRIWTPAFEGIPYANDKGATDNLPLATNIEIVNCDDDLIPIPTENIVVSGVWSYDIRHYDTHQSYLELVLKALILNLKRYWLNETYFYKHEEYGSETRGQVITGLDKTGAIVVMQAIEESDVINFKAKNTKITGFDMDTVTEELYDITFKIIFWTKIPAVLLRLKNFLLYNIKQTMPLLKVEDLAFQWAFDSLNSLTMNNNQYPQDEVILKIFRVPISDSIKLGKNALDNITETNIKTGVLNGN